MLKKEQIDLIYSDIQSISGLAQEKLTDYIFYTEGNIFWLYTPLIIRKENESVVFGWSYVINKENQILSSQIYVFSEAKVGNAPLGFFEYSDANNLHLKKIEKILNENSSLIPDVVFRENVDEVLKKYSIEIVIQNKNYRIRIRPILIQEISYDFFYDGVLGNLQFNIFNPQD